MPALPGVEPGLADKAQERARRPQKPPPELAPCPVGRETPCTLRPVLVPWPALPPSLGPQTARMECLLVNVIASETVVSNFLIQFFTLVSIFSVLHLPDGCKFKPGIQVDSHGSGRIPTIPISRTFPQPALVTVDRPSHGSPPGPSALHHTPGSGLGAAVRIPLTPTLSPLRHLDHI